MAVDKYEYRTEVLSTDPLIAAAFQVAKRAHKKQSRNKEHVPGQKDVPYISHPIMVYDLLQAMGVKDRKMLAAGLLHDAIEDNPVYRNDPKRLYHDLKEQMRNWTNIRIAGHRPFAISPAEIDTQAYGVYFLCRAVTNPKQANIDKRNDQVDHLSEVVIDARVLKMADQLASVICHLTQADNEQFTKTQAKRFGDKVQELFERMRTVHMTESLAHEQEMAKKIYAPWIAFYDKILPYYEEVLKASYMAQDNEGQVILDKFGDPELIEDRKKADAVRARFDWRHLVDPDVTSIKYQAHKDAAYSVDIEKPAVEKTAAATKRGESESEARQGGGVVRVDFDDKHRVIGYVTWQKPGGGKTHPRNLMQAKLQSRIESLRSIQAYGNETIDIEVMSNARDRQNDAVKITLPGAGRVYRFKTVDGKPISMDLKTFLAMAHDVGTMTNAEQLRVRTISEFYKQSEKTKS